MPDQTSHYTPNVGIEDPDARRKWQGALNVVLLIVALASLFFATFPEVAAGSDIPGRAVLFLNSAVTLVASVYGFTVTRPNIPKY